MSSTQRQAAHWVGDDAMNGREFTGAPAVIATVLRLVPARHRINVFVGLLIAVCAFLAITATVYAVRDYGQPTQTQVEDNSPSPTIVEPPLLTQAGVTTQ